MATYVPALKAHAELLAAARELVRARRRATRGPSDAPLYVAVDELADAAVRFALAEARHVRALAAYHRRLARTRKEP